MREYLVELYVPRDARATVTNGVIRARDAAEQLTREGTPVRYLRSLFVPEDETCFHLYDADSADAVRDTLHRAQLDFEHVAEAIEDHSHEP